MPPRRIRLYGAEGEPNEGFNQLVLSWLRGDQQLVEHSPPAAFRMLREAYDRELETLSSLRDGTPRWANHRNLLSNLTQLMFGNDISGHLAERLSSEGINPGGFRSALAQGVAKNTGENFVDAIVYAVADALVYQDDVLVDKGLPPVLRPLLTIRKRFTDAQGGIRELEFPIEVDLAIFARATPTQAILVSSKTRLKEVFHIGTMWKILFDMIGDDHARNKWGLETGSGTAEMHYCFATADMIAPGGTKTQGPDVERPIVRNLIAMDASFFDYVFVSKPHGSAAHISDLLRLPGPRESLFHELGCLLDLIQQKFSLRFPD